MRILVCHSKPGFAFTITKTRQTTQPTLMREYRMRSEVDVQGFYRKSTALETESAAWRPLHKFVWEHIKVSMKIDNAVTIRKIISDRRRAFQYAVIDALRKIYMIRHRVHEFLETCESQLTKSSTSPCWIFMEVSVTLKYLRHTHTHTWETRTGIFFSLG